jgi:exopolysaccharide biosynthesis polyprenyl glycosylphosphotransferase
MQEMQLAIWRFGDWRLAVGDLAMIQEETQLAGSTMSALSEQRVSAPGDVCDGHDDVPATLRLRLPGRTRRLALLGVLVASDAVAIALAWLLVSLLVHRWQLAGPGVQVGRLAMVTAVGVIILALEGLGRLLAAPVWSVEMVRLGRVAVGTAVVAYLVGLVSRGQRREALLGLVVCYVFVALSRRLFAGTLRAMRLRGRCLDPVLVVGNDAEAASVAMRLQEHPEFGFRVCGLMAEKKPAMVAAGTVPLLGPPSATLQVARRVGATGTVMSAGGLSSAERNSLVRRLMRAGLYVQVSAGLSGIAHTRLRPVPLGFQPFFGVEHIALGRTQLLAKRTLDLVIAPLVLLLAAPVLILAAVLIKLHDRGPIVFRQERVGQDGRPFMLFKLRTMSVDAEERRASLLGRNERKGPLFKVTDDPRVTPIGRILRATSIDELPQLMNVILGQMTLVGPRPALPDEVAQFDEQLLERHRMTPGITGMWQVEARDDPSFESYRMFDMFYVENWSFSLDLAIIFSTATAVILRAVRQVGARAGLGDRSTDSDCGARGEQESHDRAVVLTSPVMASRGAESVLVAAVAAE